MRVAREYGVISLQPPFSIVWRFPREVHAFCSEHGIAVTAYSPLAQGLLTGRFTREGERPAGWRTSNILFSSEHWPQARQVALQLDALADRLGCTPSQAALAWVLRTPGITTALVGASRPAQWEENLKALEVELGDEEYAALERAGWAVWERFEPELSMWGFKPQ